MFTNKIAPELTQPLWDGVAVNGGRAVITQDGKTLTLAQQGMALLSVQTVTTAVAAITFNNMDTTYDEYILEFNNASPSVNNSNIYVQYVTNGSVNSSANYNWHVDISVMATSTVSSNGGTSGYIYAAAATSNTAGWGTQGRIHFYNMGATNPVKYWTVFTVASGGQCIGSGYFNGSALFNGIQISTTGNFTSGTFRLYGVRSV